ncbi:BTAD domain-containing putative transcriptional regulator [Micromonospora sp. NPDC049175]|uniref:AfsR/SARP family transcriptional regulator n=1 Tax=Micromonospora sp. NPDC049175 TaxID=3364266 RepID=UPI00371664D3
MEFRLLGPVEATIADHPVQLGGVKPRTLLAALLVEHGHVVPAERLVDVIWGDGPPGTARAVLQTYVATLRRSLGSGGVGTAIVTRSPGYLIQIGAATLDRDLFEELLTQGRRAAADGHPEEAVELIRRAGGQWRGAALGGVESELLAGEAARLEELRLTAAEERTGIELQLGRTNQVAAELADLVRRHPFRERMRGQLMRALSALGRRSDALAVYRAGRESMIDELGIEPGPEIQAIHEAILRDELEQHRPPPSAGPAARALPSAPVSPALATPPARTVPAQLPPVPADFTGRSAERGRLAQALTAATVDRPAPIQVIVGPGGVGKSTLAAQVAHDVTASFPDGQLYAELRGMSGSPVEPREVLGRFLLALGTAVDRLPDGVEERVELYRTRMAGRRSLILLDDAATEQQIRPLLPCTVGCVVVVTSRSPLGGLAGRVLTELSVLPEEESVELLVRLIGEQRAAAEDAATSRIVRQCGGLPLAIRVAGARLANRQRWPLTLLADRLADERRRLDELAVGDQEVRASIGLSYRGLEAGEAAVLRVLGLLGLPEFPAWVAAIALELSEEEAEQAIERLMDAQLTEFVQVDCTGHLRYRLHDLVRLYARERAEAEHPEPELRELVSRVTTSWLWLIDAVRRGAPTGPPPAGVGPALDDLIERVLDQPRSWFAAEHDSLVRAVEVAAERGLDQQACDLASLLSTFPYATASRFESWTRTHDVALAAARRSGNRYGEAVLLSGFGQLRCAQDRYAESAQYLTQALEAFREGGHRREEALTLTALGATCRDQCRFAEALYFLGCAEPIVRDLGDQAALAEVRRLAGAVQLEQGDLVGARTDLELALRDYETLGDRRGVALTWRMLSLHHRAGGELHEALALAVLARDTFLELDESLLAAYGDRAVAKVLIRLDRGAEAAGLLERSLATSRRAGDRWGEAVTLRVVGELHLARRELADAERYLRASLRLWDELKLALPRARVLRDLARLAALRGHDDADQLALQALRVFEDHGAREHAELAAELAGTSSPGARASL